MIHDLNLTIIYWILLLEQSIMQCSMSIIVVCQIVNSGLTIISMYSSVFIVAVCRKGRWTNIFRWDRRSDHKNRVHSLTGWFHLAWEADIQKGRARVCEKHYYSYLNKCHIWGVKNFVRVAMPIGVNMDPRVHKKCKGERREQHSSPSSTSTGTITLHKKITGSENQRKTIHTCLKVREWDPKKWISTIMNKDLPKGFIFWGLLTDSKERQILISIT